MDVRSLEYYSSMIRGNNTKRYFDEAILDYQIGNLRSSILSLWVAVIFDIIDKIRELAIQGNQEAVNFIESIDQLYLKPIEEQFIQEKNIIAELKKFEILSVAEYNYIERLKVDRNHCAHPYFYPNEKVFEPSRELVRYHLSSSADLLLIREPIQGKTKINDILSKIEEESFPKDIDNIRKTLSSNYYLGRAKESVKRNIIQCLLKKIFLGQEVNYGLKIHFINVLKVLKDLYSLLFQEVFGSHFEKLVAQGSEENLKFYYFLMGVLEQNITLDSALEIRLTSIFENFNLDDLIFYRVSEYIDSLSSKFQSIYLGKLKDSSNNLQKMNELFNIKNKCNFSALIDIFKNASSFEVANHYGQFLHEYANFFDEDNISELLLAIKNNSQLYYSYIHHYSLPLLYKKTKMYTKIWRDFSKDMEDHVAKNYWAPFLATMNN